MRLILLLSALVAVGTAGRGKAPVDATVKKNFIDTFKEATTETEKVEKLTKQLANLPGKATRKDMTVLVSLSQLYYNNTAESDILLKTFDSFIDYAIEQRSSRDVANLQRTEWSTVVGDKLNNQLRAELHRIRAEEFPEIYNQNFGKCPNYKMVYDYIRDIFKYFSGQEQTESYVDMVLSGPLSNDIKKYTIAKLLLGDCREAHECADQILANENETDISCAFGALVHCATENNTENLPGAITYSRAVFILKTQMDQLFLEEPSPYVKMAYSNFIQFFFEELAEHLLENATFVDLMPLVKKHVTSECESQFDGQESFEFCTQYRRAHSTFMRLYRIITMFYQEWEEIYEQFIDGSIDAALENPIVARYLGDQLHSPKTIPNIQIFADIIENLRELHTLDNGSYSAVCNIRAYSKAAILTIHSILANTTRAQLNRDLEQCPDILTLETEITWYPTTPSPTTTQPPLVTSTISVPSTTTVPEWYRIVAAKLEKIAAVINNKVMKGSEKLAHAIEFGLVPLTPQYEAFKYLIKIRELYQAGIFKPNSYPSITTYNKRIFGKLQEGYFHNETCDAAYCLSVRNHTQFELADEDRNSLIEIEDFVFYGIYAAEQEIPKQIFGIAAEKKTDANQRVQRILDLFNVTGIASEIEAFVTTYVEAVKYKDVLKREKGEKQTTALLTYLELMIAGSVREGVLLPLDIDQYEDILDFLKNAYYFELILGANQYLAEEKLVEAGFTPELREFIGRQLSQLTLKQHEELHIALSNFDICPISTPSTSPPETTTPRATTITPIAIPLCNCSAPVYPPPTYPPFWPVLGYPWPYPPMPYPFPTRVTTYEYGYPNVPYSGEYRGQFPYERSPLDVKTRRSVQSKGDTELVKNLLKRTKRQTVHEFYADISKASRIGHH